MSLDTYLVIASLWLVYLMLHSALASTKMKKWVKHHLGLGEPYYRFIYSSISILGLGVILFKMMVAPTFELFSPPGWLKYLSMILASWGVIIVVVSFRYLSGMEFLGLKSESQSNLVKEGVHGVIRHPIYSGTILILIGFFLYHPTDLLLISDLLIFAYLPLGIKWEEKRLLEQFGGEYQRYMQEVPAIIPRIR